MRPYAIRDPYAGGPVDQAGRRTGPERVSSAFPAGPPIWSDPTSGTLPAVGPARLNSCIPWTAPLAKPIRLDDGRTIATLAGARSLLLSLPERDQQRPRWQRLAGLLLSAADADDAGLTAAATARLEAALGEPPHIAGIMLATARPIVKRKTRKRRA
jgi:hypothetical protein